MKALLMLHNTYYSLKRNEKADISTFSYLNQYFKGWPSNRNSSSFENPHHLPFYLLNFSIIVKFYFRYLFHTHFHTALSLPKLNPFCLNSPFFVHLFF